MDNNEAGAVDIFTPRLHLPLPNAANLLSGDVSRLLEALVALDKAATVGQDGKVEAGQLPEGLVHIDPTTRKIPRGYYAPEVVIADGDTGKVPTPADYGLASAEELERVSGLLEQALANVGDPVSSARWIPSRALLSLPEWAGYVAGDGALLPRAAFPSLFALVESGKVPTCTDQDWLADPSKRGCYTAGNGTTTFRIPDYNGVSAGTIGAAFLRGDGLNSAGVAGRIQGDAIRNITGSFAYATATGSWMSLIAISGAFSTAGAAPGSGARPANGAYTAGDKGYGVVFNASSSVPTAEENRPVNITGCHVIRAFGKAVDTGEVDMGYIASEVERMRRYTEPVLKVEWMPLRAAPFDGFAPGDGQLFSRALYPDAWDAIRTGKVPVCTDQDWLADPSKRGCYTAGNGVDTFRIPDYNGVSVGSYGPAYLGGSGAGGGAILRDRIQNITGETNFSGSPGGLVDSTATATGAFKVGASVLNYRPSDATVTGRGRTLVFDASGAARTGDTTRPITAEGCFGVRLYGSVQNQGRLDVEALTAEVEELKKGAAPVCTVEWVSSRRAVRNGYTPSDGQLLSRAMYPDVWGAIEAGRVPVCTDQDWLLSPANRGCFTPGNGTTTFRVPDYNGKSEGSLGAAFLRGDGLNSIGVEGKIQNDAIRNIRGSSTANGFSILGVVAENSPTSAVFIEQKGVTRNYGPTAASADWGNSVGFDASRAVPTAADNHPVNATGCWCIKLFGAVQVEGVASLFELASSISSLLTRVSVLEGKVTALEQRKSTCLVNAVGTGAPHETVVTQLPASVTTNSRYILPNPFGAGTPVLLVTEIFLNNSWCDPSFVLADGNVGYGVRASHKSDAGIVVQTGNGALVAIGYQSGTGHVVTGSITSAPCRVFVRKMEA